MSKKPETNFRAKVRRELTDLVIESGGLLWFEAIQQRAINGSPDFILCANGCFMALELKSEDGEVSQIQEVKMNAILEAGGLALVAEPKNWHSTLSTIMFYLEGDPDDDCGGHGEGS